MAIIERRRGRRRDANGRERSVVSYRIRYRDAKGAQHSETMARHADAERRRSEIEQESATSTWHDRRRGYVLLREWVAAWLATRHDFRATTRVRLEVWMKRQVLPRFGDTSLNDITNGDVLRWSPRLVSPVRDP